MPLYITNPEADRLARRLAEQTGESLTDAVITALRERLERTEEPSVHDRLTAALGIARHAATLIGKSTATTDDLYDEHGLPA
jgi:antitoxin VapB